MSIALRRTLGRHYVWVVVATTFVALLAAAGLRSAPGVMMPPLQRAFGWDRATLSLAAAIGIFLYGLVGPFAAALMQTLGIRRTLLAGIGMMAAATALSLWMTQPWQYVLTWGVLSGLGSGAVAPVLGAAVANRWFHSNRGLVMGVFSASAATGALAFLPVLAALSQHGWRPVAITVSLVMLALLPVVAWLFPEHPGDLGITAWGAVDLPEEAPSGRARDSVALALGTLRRAAGQRVFWLLAGTFFICGLTTNGLIGVHLISYCGDRGLGPVAAAGLLATMGVFDLFGTTASGWLTDRVDPRRLLFAYYVLRGLSLLALPYLNFDFVSLTGFAVFYGLDWIATVPPTLRLTTEAFGEREGAVVFGWVLAAHQAGAATAAYGAGVIRSTSGSYLAAFVAAGAAAVLAGFAALAIVPRREPQAVAA